MLIDAGTDVNIKNDDGCTALMIASRESTLYSNIKTVKMLIDGGANINSQDIEGQGPRFLPICKMYKECDCVSSRPYQIIKKNSLRIPSWCDRILHTPNIVCVQYQSFDRGFTCKSDHFL